MLLCQRKADRPSNQVWITPRSAIQAVVAGVPVLPPRRGQGRVMLVDEPRLYREQTAASLADAGVGVLQASDVYEALRLGRGSEIDLLVIGGDQRDQSGWRCAGKLCGRSPWPGVILYFAHASDRDRLWGRVSQVEALVETKGQTEPLVRAVLQGLGRSLTAADHPGRVAKQRAN